MKPTKKAPAMKKPKVDRICDLVDCWIDEKITQGVYFRNNVYGSNPIDELVEKLMTIVGKPIIKVSEVEFIVSKWNGQLYLESRQELSDGCKDNWTQVEDLCDLTVYEYNDLVTQLHEVYPDYPIEHLEGRFV